jgi:hypothetical protein
MQSSWVDEPRAKRTFANVVPSGTELWMARGGVGRDVHHRADGGLGPHLPQFVGARRQNPDIRPYLDKYMRGSNGYDAVDRVKLTKLLWDSMGTEFAGRHELYEITPIACADGFLTAAPAAR